MKTKFIIYTILVLFFSSAAFFETASAQARRDHLTDEEVEIVRDVQELDRRMEVFVKAIDRRFLVLNNDTSQAKQVEKDLDKWGELPKGTRLQLLSDIQKILDEATVKIEDVVERDKNNDLIPFAVHVLADGARRFVPMLQTARQAATDDREKGLIDRTLEMSNRILEVSATIPKPDKKKKKKNESDRLTN